MTDRSETTITTLTEHVGDARYVARIEGGVVEVTAQTIETYATVTLPLAALEGFAAFLDAVRADPAAVVAESDPTPDEEPNPAPTEEPTPEEEATNG
ncbi:hypothetical protein SEA_DELAGARZA_23 [Microbacterium phage DelaGarza]|nr:hypothetical protein SEA_DELAGARZA_23 [Microbacterium phage DelaGarza]